MKSVNVLQQLEIERRTLGNPFHASDTEETDSFSSTVLEEFKTWVDPDSEEEVTRRAEDYSTFSPNTKE